MRSRAGSRGGGRSGPAAPELGAARFFTSPGGLCEAWGLGREAAPRRLRMMEENSDGVISSAEITRLLVSIRQGRREAVDQLLPIVYDEMRAMARRRLGARPPSQTLDTTGLVHEAYLKLFDQTRLVWEDRKHFYSVVAMAMRQIIVDHARRRMARKRGAGQQLIDIESANPASEDRIEQVLAVHEALEKLKLLDERLASLVELRYFAGLSVEETADVLGMSDRTVKRDWRKARALLYEALRSDEGT